MLNAYIATVGQPLTEMPADGDLSKAQWIDLFEPTEQEKQRVCDATGLRIASMEELDEIENSSRLAFDGTALYLSMPLVAKVEGMEANTKPLGFVVTKEESGPALDIFVLILESITDRMADILERVRDELDRISKQIFTEDTAGMRGRKQDLELQNVIKAIGRAGDQMSRVRDSLLGVGRIVPYTAQVAAPWIDRDLRDRMKSIRQDVASLSDYDMHLNGKMQFLLDATLGLINTTQNNIIKVLTVVSVVGVPPTLVASIYGMNFKDMPELNWAYGYPYGLTVIVLSAVLPLLWFRIRGWL
jgi:magnesium transporter